MQVDKTNPTGESSMTVSEAADLFYNRMQADSSTEAQAEAPAPEADVEETANVETPEAELEVETQDSDVVEDTTEVAEEEVATEEQPEVEAEAEAEGDVFEIGGKEWTEAQLLEAHEKGLRQEDYTRKTQSLAQEREAIEQAKADWEAEKAAMEAEFQTEREKFLARFADDLTVKLEAMAETDWDTLKAEDPFAYAEKMADFQRLQIQAEEANKEWEGEKKQLTEKQQEEYNNYILQQQEIIFDRVPELASEETRQAKMETIVDFLTKEGFVPEEMTITDGRWWGIMEKARKYDELQNTGEQAKGKKVVRRTKTLRAGNTDAKTAAKERTDKQWTESRNRLRQSGSVDDAAALFLRDISKR